MTFDIDKAISKRFQKGEGFEMFAPADGIYRDTASMRLLDEADKARKAGDTQAADRYMKDYNDNAESLYDASETHVPNVTRGKDGRPVFGEPIKSPGRPDAIATELNKEGIYWHHPMMNRSAERARGNTPDDETAEEQAVKQMARKTGRNKRDLDTALTEIATGENPAYNALPPGRSVDAFIDQVMGHMQAGMSFEDAINTAAESMTGRSLKKSCDIDSRMDQWSAAGRAQHIGETEKILKGGSPRGNFVGRSDYMRLEKMINDLLDMTGGSLSEVRKILDSLTDRDIGWMDDYVRAANGMDNKKEAEEIRLVSPTDPSGLEGYIGHMEDAKNPNAPMNRIGADKPKAIETVVYDPPYDEQSSVSEDVTESSYGAGQKELAKKAKEIVETLKNGAEGDYEGE